LDLALSSAAGVVADAVADAFAAFTFFCSDGSKSSDFFSDGIAFAVPLVAVAPAVVVPLGFAVTVVLIACGSSSFSSTTVDFPRSL
jgi:hypothetical protein